MDNKRLKKPYGQYSKKQLKRIIKQNIQIQLEGTTETSSAHPDIPDKKRSKNNIPSPVPSTSNDMNNQSRYAQSPSLSNFHIEEKEQNFKQSEFFCDDKEKLFLINLKSWIIEHHISHNACNKLLFLMRNDLDIQNLPKDCRTFLKSDKSSRSEIIEMPPGSYYHFGLRNGLENVLKQSSKKFVNGKLSISLNIDGLPLTKSSCSQFWPILASLDNEKQSRPFPVGIYHGNAKPHDVNDFLKPIVDEVKSFEENDIIINDKQYQVEVSKILCDAPAKAFILNVKGHNAYFGCTKCIIEGEYINNRMSYLDLKSPLRTDDTFKTMVDENYHKGYTVLSQTSIGLVSQIPLDYMHLVCLGVMKNLLIFWFRGKMGIRLFKEEVDTINENLERYRKFAVKEFSRLPRPLSELDRWKATEYRQFLLYYGPVLIKPYLKEPMFSHFLSLHVAIRILSSNHSSPEQIDYAEKLLEYFVRKFPDIYGQEQVSHNIHNLIHLSNDVRKFGTLDQLSCFKFENFMSEIKKTLKTSNYPLQQFINRHYEYETYCADKFLSDTTPSLLLSHEDGWRIIKEKHFQVYRNAFYKNLQLSVKEPNCFCILNTGSAVKILNFFYNEGNPYIHYQKFSEMKNYYELPCSSLNFNCGIVEKLTDNEDVSLLDHIIQKAIMFDKVLVSLIHTALS